MPSGEGKGWGRQSHSEGGTARAADSCWGHGGALAGHSWVRMLLFPLLLPKVQEHPGTTES